MVAARPEDGWRKCAHARAARREPDRVGRVAIKSDRRQAVESVSGGGGITADPKPRRAQVAAAGPRGVGVGGPDPAADLRPPHPLHADRKSDGTGQSLSVRFTIMGDW